VRSLAAIEKLNESKEGIELELTHFEAPKMYENGNRLVSCFLYAPQDEKSLPKANAA